MDDEIKIKAEVLNEETCEFAIDRPVYPGGSVYFASKEAAKGSPLAEAQIHRSPRSVPQP